MPENPELYIDEGFPQRNRMVWSPEMMFHYGHEIAKRNEFFITPGYAMNSEWNFNAEEGISLRRVMESFAEEYPEADD